MGDGRLAFVEFMAGLDLAEALNGLNWQEIFEQALDRSESIFDLLTTEPSIDTPNEGSLSAQDTALLVGAALVIAVVVGGELLALLVMASAELAFAADLTSRAASAVGHAWPRLQGAAYLYFIGDVVAGIARAASGEAGRSATSGDATAPSVSTTCLEHRE